MSSFKAVFVVVLVVVNVDNVDNVDSNDYSFGFCSVIIIIIIIDSLSLFLIKCIPASLYLCLSNWRYLFFEL